MELGPEHGILTLHTTRSGAAAKVGHDLTLRLDTWLLQRDAAGVVTLQIDLRSLVVLSGDGGVKALTDKDKTTIVANALECMHANQNPTVTVRVEAPPITSGVAQGQARIVTTTRPIALNVQISGHDPIRVVTTGTVRQSEFGIKPYSAMLGTLKVADDVTVRLDLAVPGSLAGN